jgi:stage II sporulation protein D
VPIAVVATGAGYGHGVGLCQWGALEMARRGRDFENILKHYFAGIEIRRASDLRG